MTDPMAATPGWVADRLDDAFAPLPRTAAVAAARAAYAECLAARKAPAAPSDMLGAEFAACRPALRRAVLAAGVDEAAVAALEARLGAVEAEVAGES